MADDVDRSEFAVSQLFASVEAVQAARDALSVPGLTECEGCGEEIPLARRQALPSARMCLPCAAEEERRMKVLWG